MTLQPEGAPGFPPPQDSFPGASTNLTSPTPVSAGQIEAWRGNFIELVLQAVVQALTGFNTPGTSAFDQLRNWADSIPLVGDIVNMFIEFLSGGEQTSGGLDDLLGLLNNIPLIGDLIDIFTSGQGAGNGVSGPSGLAGIFGQIVAMLGGLIGVGTGGFDPGTGATQQLSNLRRAGIITTYNTIPPHTLAQIAPGASKNVQPDPDFNMGRTSILGQGRWFIDNIGGSPAGSAYGTSFCVRTIARHRIPVYCVEGTQQMQQGMPAGDPIPDVRDYIEGYLIGGGDAANTKVMIDRVLDWDKFEIVRVPYAAALFPLAGSIQEGTVRLVNLIKANPGPFMMYAGSLGTGVIGNVLRELQTGVLKHRLNDLMLALNYCGIVREQGTGFPNPYTDARLIYDPVGHGILLPNNTGTVNMDRWWEFAADAGTYPAFDSLTGVTWSKGDPFSAMGDNPQEVATRQAVLEHANDSQFSYGLLMSYQLVIEGLTPGASTHGGSPFIVQPFLSEGDHRTFHEYAWDTIDEMGEDYTPGEPEEHELEGVFVPVKPGQIVIAESDVCWLGVVCHDDAIAVRVNVYDSNHLFLETVWSDTATVFDPASPSQDWLRLSGRYLMPDDAAFACISLWVAAEAMRSGTVWFGETNFEPGAVLDASLLGNMENVTQLLIDSVTGEQGDPTLSATFQSLLDGLASAASQQTRSNVTKAEMFDIIQDMAMSTFNAMDLGLSHDERLAALEELLEQEGPGAYHPPAVVSYPVPGQYLWTIPLWLRDDGALFDCVALGGGGGAGGKRPEFPGQGGDNSVWAKTTLVMGVHIPSGTTQLIVNVGVGGLGSATEAGADGTDSYIQVPDGPVLLVSPGGQHGNPGTNWNPLNTNINWMGRGTFNTSFQGLTYFGGTTVGVWDQGTSGSPPGGGGASPGGIGADGKVWISVGRT